jgi:hypothetical protein
LRQQPHQRLLHDLLRLGEFQPLPPIERQPRRMSNRQFRRFGKVVHAGFHDEDDTRDTIFKIPAAFHQGGFEPPRLQDAKAGDKQSK